jgi:hypothetical protein
MATPTTLPSSFNTGDVLTAAQMNDLRGAFRVLQVKQTVKNDTTSTTSSTRADVTGLTVDITPGATSNKILVWANMMIGFDGTADDTFFYMVRGSTLIGNGTGATVANASAFQRGNSYSNQNLQLVPVSFWYLDSPSTTSSTTYKLQWSTRVGTIYLNRRGNDTNVVASSSITVMEVSA